MSPAKEGLFNKLLRIASHVRPEEVKATVISFFLVFMLMAAYYLLRPLRDAMASDWSDTELSWLWTLTFVFSAIVVSLYGMVIRKISFHWLVPSVYAFFAFSFLIFYLAASSPGSSALIDKSFYVWISVFSLFHISVFWSLMTELFNKQQSKRLFGFIGSGASAGAIAGPGIALLLATYINLNIMLLLASLILISTIALVLWLQSSEEFTNTFKDKSVQTGSINSNQTSFNHTSLFDGFSILFKSRYLIAIAIFIVLYTSISSFVYFELKNLLSIYDRETRTQIWASMDLIVNLLTISTAIFITGRVASRFGISVTLACIPVLIGAGLLILAFMPLVGVIIAVQIIRRAGNYAVTRPGREMLFTLVDRDTRFKVKPVIDIVLYRGGDMINAWAFTALTQGLGLSLAAVAAVGAGIAAVWAAIGIYLGKIADKSPSSAV